MKQTLSLCNNVDFQCDFFQIQDDDDDEDEDDDKDVLLTVGTTATSDLSGIRRQHCH